MIITSDIFGAYLHCPAKCRHCSRQDPTKDRNVYAEWDRARNESYRAEGIEHLLATIPERDRAIAPALSANMKQFTWRLAVDATLQVKNLETRLDVVE